MRSCFYAAFLFDRVAELTMFEIETCSQEDIITHAPLLEEWMRRDYIHYPYLWVPAQGETCLDLFINEKSTLLTLLKWEGRVVSIAAGMVFESENLASYFDAPLAKLVEDRGIQPQTLYYISIFLTSPDCRNEKAIVESMYDAHAQYAKQLDRTHLCFWSTVEIPHHPLKPDVLTPIEPWGYVVKDYEPMHIELNMLWTTLQVDHSVKEEVHPIQFFMKPL